VIKGSIFQAGWKYKNRHKKFKRMWILLLFIGNLLILLKEMNPLDFTNITTKMILNIVKNKQFF
jgi:hypothetical protein